MHKVQDKQVEQFIQITQFCSESEMDTLLYQLGTAFHIVTLFSDFCNNLDDDNKKTVDEFKIDLADKIYTRFQLDDQYGDAIVHMQSNGTDLTLDKPLLATLLLNKIRADSNGK